MFLNFCASPANREQNCVTTLQLRNIMRPFEKGKTLSDQAVPIAELISQLAGVMKQVGDVKKKKETSS
jgi:hypothetical protein